MKPGDLVNMTSCTIVTPDGSRFTFKPNRGDAFVFMLMGVEPKDGSKPIDGAAVMERLGWQPKKAPRKKKVQLVGSSAEQREAERQKLLAAQWGKG